jgi:RimJ/RimL family protein N-acetyltransferase
LLTNAADPAYDGVRLSDGRVALRPWRVADAALMAAACADPDIALFCMMPAGYTEAMARDFIADAPRAWAQEGWLHLALTLSGDDQPLGAVGALAVDRRSSSAELGYWVVPEQRRRGLARAGVGLVSDWAFETLHLRRLAIGTMVGNLPSRRIARALGYRPEALFRSYRQVGERRTDCVSYSLLRGEWQAWRAASGGVGTSGDATASGGAAGNRTATHAGGSGSAGLPPDELLLPSLAAARTDYPTVTPTLPTAPPPLGDGTIVLRPYAEADVADLVRACNDPETLRWVTTLPDPYTETDAREFLAQAARGWETSYDALYCIADAASDRLLGGVGLHGVEAWAGVAEIGYHVAPWARRRGVATAATRLVAHWGTEVLGLARIQILADTRNAASCGVAARLGFTREGLQRADHGREGDMGDHAVFSLLAGDRRPW